MAQAQHDSSFELTFVPISGGAASAAPGGADSSPERVRGSAPGENIPTLDLNSSGPLPELPEESALPSPPAAPRTPMSLPATNGQIRRGSGSLWLQGDVLMCPCPDCSAPMSVRVWLMVADCWKCGTSIELSEEQEREARRLLRERDEALRRQRSGGDPGARDRVDFRPTAGATVAGTTETVDGPSTPTANSQSSEAVARSPDSAPQRDQQGQPRERPRERQRRRRRPAAQRPVGARAKIRKMAVAGTTRVWISELFGNMPAWLVSFVFHVVLLIILNLLMMSEKPREREILLTTEVSTQRKEGGDPEAQLAKDDVVFDLPVPSKDWLENDSKREVLIKADQEARKLRLDPDAPTPDLPPLEKVQNVLQSKDTVRRTFAARDPRMRVEMVKAEGGTTLTEAAVARALRFLANEQNHDGGWGRTLGRSEAAGTSLALLPFLGAGQTHQTGIYEDKVAMGLRWLIRQQSENGDLRGSLKNNNAGMYAHGQGAIVLSEAYALTGDEQLRGPAQKAIDFIVEAQHVGGGWRYQPGEAGDTSVLGWQLMALHSARVSGLNVPDATLELAGNYLDSVQSVGGARYSYRRGTSPNAAMTAEGLLCRMYTGWTKRNPALEKGLGILLDKHRPHVDEPNIYYWYYGTQVAHHMGGEQWRQWNLRMRDILVQSQVDSGRFAGAWRPKGPHTKGNDWIYMTSLATCCLEVYYRHAPLFRQIELEEEALATP